MRTNFYQTDNGRPPKALIAFKFDSAKIDDLPLPRPLFEIFVYSPRVEGVHLRFGKVARGGIRWSDRPQDFRTEILGLVKAQQVKNAVIVPVGAKGGFVPKRCRRRRRASSSRPRASPPTRSSSRRCSTSPTTSTTTARSCRRPRGAPRRRRSLSRGRRRQGHRHLLRHRQRAVARARLLARRRLRLRRLGRLRPQEDGHHRARRLGIGEAPFPRDGRRHPETPFTVRRRRRHVGRRVRQRHAAVAQTTKLVAAFDHRDIFIDPDPDPAKAFAERQRLFDLPRSSWQDYDKSLISQGGGVSPRVAKAIRLSPAAQKLLGVGARP